MNESQKEKQLKVFYKINTEEPNVPNVNLTYVYFPINFTWIKKGGD